MGERIRRVKVRKVASCYKDSLIGKTKATQAKQNKEFIHHFPPADRCSTITRKAGLHHMWWLLGKTSTVIPNVPCTTSSSFSQLSIVEHDLIWCGIFHQSVWVSCPSCVPLQLLYPPSLLDGGLVYEVEEPWLCKYHSAVTMKPCAVNTVFSTSQKRSPVPATLEKINFILGKTSTCT